MAVPEAQPLLGVRQPSCLSCKTAFYFVCLTGSLVGIGIGGYNIITDPPQVMLTIAKYTLPSIGAAFFASSIVSLKNTFSPKEVVIMSEAPLDQTQQSDAMLDKLNPLLDKVLVKLGVEYKVTQTPIEQQVSKKMEMLQKVLEDKKSAEFEELDIS